MLFLTGLAIGALLMALARRRSDTICLRLEQRLVTDGPDAWVVWPDAGQPEPDRAPASP